MSHWWLKLLGVDTDRIPPDAQTSFIFDNAPQSWRVFVMLALVGGLLWGVFYIYRREMLSLPRRARVVLAGVRSLVIVLIVLALMGPALAIATQRIVEPFIVLLVDESQSMSIRDRYPIDEQAQRVAGFMGQEINQLRTDPVSRAQVIDRLLGGDDAQLIRELARKGKVRVMSFSQDLKLRQSIDSLGGDGSAEAVDEEGEELRAGLEVGEPVPPLRPSGSATNLARALRESMRALAGKPVAGIVLISDGQNTEGDDPLSAADGLASQNVPIFSIGVGDSSKPQNLSVAQVWAPDSVFREDPFIIEAEVISEGYDGQTVVAELLARSVGPDGSAGAELKLDSQRLTLGSAGVPRVRFEHKPEKDGDYIYIVRIEPMGNEVLDTDNQKSLPVKVLSDKARVLLIAGAPSWEYRLVMTLLKRDKTTDVSCWLQTMDPNSQQEGNTVIEKLPATQEELFKYDVIVFLDPDPSEFDEAWIAMLEKFLTDHAGGVFWMAGPKFTPRFVDSPRTSGIRDILPVTVGQLTALDVESLVMTHTRQWPMRLTANGTDHAMLRLEQDPVKNRAAWESMPGIFWSFPARQAKPGCQVLLEHTDPRLRTREGQRPLLVTGQFGPGRTVFMGFNGTWRWRAAGEKYFDQFWVQTMRFLVEGRLMGEKKRGRIATDRDVYPAGARVAVSAKLFDRSFNPLNDPVVSATLRGPGGESQSFELRALANQPGSYEGSIIVGQFGLNEIVVNLSGGEEGLVRVAKQITAEVPRVEYADTRLDRAMLENLAQRTGGAYLEIDEVGGLAERIPDRLEVITIKGAPVELWDTPQLVVILVILLTIEWAVRKRYKLM